MTKPGQLRHRIAHPTMGCCACRHYIVAGEVVTPQYSSTTPDTRWRGGKIVWKVLKPWSRKCVHLQAVGATINILLYVCEVRSPAIRLLLQTPDSISPMSFLISSSTRYDSALSPLHTLLHRRYHHDTRYDGGTSKKMCSAAK